MQGYLAIATVILLMAMIFLRVSMLKKLGIRVIQFGKMDKKDFIIPPFALLYFYLIFADVLGLPRLGFDLFRFETISWIGVALCILGLALLLFSLISFGKSFRVGIDEEHPGSLVTTGAYAISRNPIYTAFGLIIIGIFLISTNWVFLLYTIAGIWLFNRQVLCEESSLKKIYGFEYIDYCKKVRRYI